MKLLAWVVAWFYGIQTVNHFTHTPGMFLAGMVLLTGFFCLVQLVAVLCGWKR